MSSFAGGPDARISTALIDYFSGSIDINAFKSAVESHKSPAFRCFAYFHAMWYAYLTGATDAVNSFYEPLLKFDKFTCPSALQFAQKFRLQATASRTTTPLTPAGPSAGASSLLTEASALYRKKHYDEAAQKYQQLLQTQQKSDDAYVGLTRAYLAKNKLQEARDTISKGLASADSPPMHIASGEVLFREGKLQEAEAEWV